MMHDAWPSARARALRRESERERERQGERESRERRAGRERETASTTTDTTRERECPSPPDAGVSLLRCVWERGQRTQQRAATAAHMCNQACTRDPRVLLVSVAPHTHINADEFLSSISKSLDSREPKPFLSKNPSERGGNSPICRSASGFLQREAERGPEHRTC